MSEIHMPEAGTVGGLITVLLGTIWVVGWIICIMWAGDTWLKQRGYRDYIGTDGKPHDDHPYYDPDLLRRSARGILFAWAWPFFLVRWTHRLVGGVIGALMLDATAPAPEEK